MTFFGKHAQHIAARARAQLIGKRITGEEFMRSYFSFIVRKPLSFSSKSLHTRTHWLPKRGAILVATLLSAFIVSGCDVSGSTSGLGSQDPDPVVVDLPIAYVERPLPRDEDGELVEDDFIEPTTFNPGAKLILKERAATSAREKNITADVFPDVPGETEDLPSTPALYDVKDLHVSEDGLLLLFAMRAPDIEGEDPENQPKWDIWEYNRETDELRRIISDELTAQQAHDISPAYLPDGRIVFTSTRGRRTGAILLDENKSQYEVGTEEDREIATFNLHVLEESGGTVEIDQITFNPSHDLEPSILTDGRILFTRWDNFDGGPDRLALYTVNADGTNTSLLYGYDSQNTGTNDTPAIFADTIQLPDGRIMANLRTRESAQLGGDIVAIDVENFLNIDQPTYENTNSAGAGQVGLSASPVLLDDQVSTIGYYNSAYPLFDGTDRLLVSWSQCLLTESEETTVPCTDLYLDADFPETNVSYGLWIYDLNDGTQKPIKQPYDDINFTEAVVMATRQRADGSDQNIDTSLANDGVGILHIRSIYDVDGLDTTPNGIAEFADPVLTPESERDARFLRVVKTVLLPTDEALLENGQINIAEGQANKFRELLGYAPIEPDGSVLVRIPANIPFSFSVVDAAGKRVGGLNEHRNWITLQAGEVRHCAGCHDNSSDAPHGREDAQAPSAYPGAIGSIPFSNTRLLDENDIEHLPPDAEETMAEYYARINGSARPLNLNMEFTDEWTDPAATTPLESISLGYARVASGIQETAIGGCSPTIFGNADWQEPTECREEYCRIVINYQEHIAPLWSTSRQICIPETNEFGEPVLDIDGAPQYVGTSRQCIGCHSNVDPATDLPRVPLGNLSLTGEIGQTADFSNECSTNLDIELNASGIEDYVTSYGQLLRAHNSKILNLEGNLTIETFIRTSDIEELDAEGNPVLDLDGNPVFLEEQCPVRVGRAAVPGNAANSDSFFSLFEEGGSHAGYLMPSELKLIAEWLDVGGQYYNNPFDAPAN